MSQPTLIIVGRKDGGEVPLDQSVTILGRDRGVTVELADFQVSRRHALLLKTDAGTFLKDLGSRNGILVNEKRIASRKQQRLRNGDVLTLGRTSIVFKDVPAHAVSAGTNDTSAKPAPKPSATSDAPGPVPPGANGSSHAPTNGPMRELRADALTGIDLKVAEGEKARAADAPARAERPAAAGPAATPAAASDQSDLAVLRELVDRSDRDRVFYRNLTLALVGFLMVLVTLLLYYALGRDPSRGATASESPRSTTPAASAAAQTPRLEPGPTVALAPRGARELDAKAFQDEVGPILIKACATTGGCHGPPNGAGELKLEPFGDSAAVARGLEAVRRFVVPGFPERSVLLTKALRRDEGGEAHGGGEILSRQSTAYEALRQWIQRASTGSVASGGGDGATEPKTAGAKPKALATPSASSVATGDVVVLDASASTADEGPLQYRWAILDRPEGSKASIKDPLAAVSTIEPDVAGDYVVALIVADARGTRSDPVRVELKAKARDGSQGPVATAAGRPPSTSLSAEDGGRAFVLEAFVDLLGRGPRPDEAAKALAGTRGELVSELLSRDEAYEEWVAQQLLWLENDTSDPTSSLAKKLKAREVSVREALALLATWQSFQRKYPTSEPFAQVLLQKLLGVKTAEGDGKALLDSAKKLYDTGEGTLFGKTGRGAEDLARIVAGETRCLEQLVLREHRRLTGVVLPEGEVASAAAKLDKDKNAFFDLVKEWMLSPRAAQRSPRVRPKTDRVFTRSLFVDLLGRLPEADELRDAQRALAAMPDGRPLRSALVKVLLDGKGAKLPEAGSDAKAFVTAQFQRLLARDPSAKELETYVRALEGGSGEKLVVRALLTSEEYEGY